MLIHPAQYFTMVSLCPSSLTTCSNMQPQIAYLSSKFLPHFYKHICHSYKQHMHGQKTSAVQQDDDTHMQLHSHSSFATGVGYQEQPSRVWQIGRCSDPTALDECSEPSYCSTELTQHPAKQAHSCTRQPHKRTSSSYSDSASRSSS